VHGNPKPKVSWSKKGSKALHTKIDESKSILGLKNVDESHADSYSCTATNDVGQPITDDFQIKINCKNSLNFF
jgi:hypothetical protein